MKTPRKIIPSHLPFAEQQRQLKELRHRQTMQELESHARFLHDCDERYREVNQIPETPRTCDD